MLPRGCWFHDSVVSVHPKSPIMFTINLPKIKERNVLSSSMASNGVRKQVFRDKRNRRAKDARKSWQRDHGVA